jgi:hypothetical protein
MSAPQKGVSPGQWRKLFHRFIVSSFHRFRQLAAGGRQTIGNCSAIPSKVIARNRAASFAAGLR